MLTDADLAAMRAAQLTTLPSTCMRRRPTLVSDGRGGFTEAAPGEATYACRVAATRGREAEIAAKVTELLTVTVTLPHDADVQAQDTLVVGGRTFSVVAVLEGGAWMTALRVLATEVS